MIYENRTLRGTKLHVRDMRKIRKTNTKRDVKSKTISLTAMNKKKVF